MIVIPSSEWNSMYIISSKYVSIIRLTSFMWRQTTSAYSHFLYYTVYNIYMFFAIEFAKFISYIYSKIRRISPAFTMFYLTFSRSITIWAVGSSSSITTITYLCFRKSISKYRYIYRIYFNFTSCSTTTITCLFSCSIAVFTFFLFYHIYYPHYLFRFIKY